MPRNRQHLNRDVKRLEIVGAATELFRNDGFDGTRIGDVASRAGVTPNTIYWYFGDKDGLLIAVLNSLVLREFKEYSALRTKRLAVKLEWVVERLQDLNSFVQTVHSRAARSAAVDAWHSRFHEVAEHTLAKLLSDDLTDRQRRAAVQIAVYAIEGLVTHDADRAQRRAVCEMLERRFAAAADR